MTRFFLLLFSVGCSAGVEQRVIYREADGGDPSPQYQLGEACLETTDCADLRAYNAVGKSECLGRDAGLAWCTTECSGTYVDCNELAQQTGRYSTGYCDEIQPGKRYCVFR